MIKPRVLTLPFHFRWRTKHWSKGQAREEVVGDQRHSRFRMRRRIDRTSGRGTDQCYCLSHLGACISGHRRRSQTNYIHLTWAIAAGSGLDLALTPDVAARHLSAELTSSDEFKKCHPETRQVKRNFRH